MSLGTALKDAIRRKGYTVTEIAEALGIERSTLSSSLNTPGRLQPIRARDVELTDRIAKFIGADAREILEAATGSTTANERVNLGLAKLLLKTLRSPDASEGDKDVAEAEVFKMIAGE